MKHEVWRFTDRAVEDFPACAKGPARKVGLRRGAGPREAQGGTAPPARGAVLRRPGRQGDLSGRAARAAVAQVCIGARIKARRRFPTV